MVDSKTLNDQEHNRLLRKLDRERRAREEAERLLEQKSALLYDANQRLEAEAHRAKSLVAAIESASDGIAITDADGKFVFMNQAHAVMFGYRVDELVGQPWSVLYGPKELQRFDEKIMPAFSRMGYWRGETTGLSKAGIYVLQEVVLSGLPDGGLICATRDITKRRQQQIEAKELEQRLARAEQEAALFTLGNAVAHDFNNLIGAISGYAMLIQHALQDGTEPHTHARRIAQAADQAAGVIRSLELERSNDTTTLSRINLSGLIATGVSIAEAIRPPGIQIETDMPDEAYVTGNEVALSRSLLNITKNAFEAMGEEGELRIRIAETPSPPLDEKTGYFSLGEIASSYDWVIEISDTGPGIRQEKLESIFDPFYTTKPSLKGSGLGLLSLSALVESESAFVEVISRLDYGTMFRINFKSHAVADERVVSSPDVHPYEHAAEKPHILVVEDEVMMADVIASTLRNLGYAYDVYHDPRAALELLEDESYHVDVLLTDLTMPKLRGDDLASKSKTLRPSLPVIIYSGQAAYLKPSETYAAILRKPIAASDLDLALKRALATG